MNIFMRHTFYSENYCFAKGCESKSLFAISRDSILVSDKNPNYICAQTYVMECYGPKPGRGSKKGMRDEDVIIQKKIRQSFVKAIYTPKRGRYSAPRPNEKIRRPSSEQKSSSAYETNIKSSTLESEHQESSSIVDMSSDSDEETTSVKNKDKLIDKLAEEIIKLRKEVDLQKNKKEEYKKEMIKIRGQRADKGGDSIPLQRENIQLGQDLKKLQTENAELSISAREVRTIRKNLVAKILLHDQTDEDEESLMKMNIYSLFSKYEKLTVMNDSSGDAELRLLKDSHSKLKEKYERLRESHDELKANDESNTSLCDMLRQTLKEAIPERFSETKDASLREKLENVSAKLEQQSVIRRNHEQLIQDLKDILGIESEDCRFSVILDEVRELKRLANVFHDQREAADIAVALRETSSL